MKLNLRQLLADKFVFGTFILTLANLLGSVLNYLVHPILTRHLSVAAYGDFQALQSFLTILSIITAVIITTMTREVSVLSARQPAAVPVLRRRAFWCLAIFGLTAFVFLSAFLSPLNRLLKIGEPSVLLIASLFLLYIFPLAANRATINGLQRFPALAMVNLSEPVCRLLLVVALVVLWPLGLYGAAWALGLTSVLALLVSLPLVKVKADQPVSPDLKVSLRALWPYAALVLWFTALYQFFYNFDMLFVKSFFSPEEAGLYGAMLTIGRIIYFIGGTVPLVMFPVLAGLAEDRSLRKYGVLLKSLGLMSLVILPATLFISLFPHLTINFVVGAKYLILAPYLPLFSIVILLLTLMTVLSQYFLALSRRGGLLLLSLGAGLEIVMLGLFHTSFWSVIYSLLWIFAAIDLALLLLLLFEYRSAKRKIYAEQI
ncbi:MAG: oligosaccharide flippase family protein [Patescibacteria group bacterium]